MYPASLKIWYSIGIVTGIKKGKSTPFVADALSQAGCCDTVAGKKPTCQGQFESEIRAGDFLDLDRLNTAFSAWLKVAYHQSVHSETGQSPKERYESNLLAPIQGIPLDTSIRFFMKKEKRKVHPDFSDVSLKGRLYKVDPKLLLQKRS